MDKRKRESIRLALRALTESYTATMQIMEQTYALLCDELSMDAWTYHQQASSVSPANPNRPIADRSLMTVTFQGRACFLGNTLPFRLIEHLIRRVNVYATYEELFAEVWRGNRTEAAVRSVVKNLRARLRTSGLDALADAIDGSVSGHYALRLLCNG